MVQKIIFLIFILSFGCASIHENIAYQSGAKIDLGNIVRVGEVIDLPIGLKSTIKVVEFNS